MEKDESNLQGFVVPEDLPDGIFFTAELSALRHSKAAAVISLKSRGGLNVEKSHWKSPDGTVHVRNWVGQGSEPAPDPWPGPDDDQPDLADWMEITAKVPKNPME